MRITPTNSLILVTCSISFSSASINALLNTCPTILASDGECRSCDSVGGRLGLPLTPTTMMRSAPRWMAALIGATWRRAPSP